MTAVRPASPESEATETTAASRPASSAPTVVPPSHSDGPAFFGRHHYSDGPASRGFHRYSPRDPVGPIVHPTGVGHSLGAMVPPTYYGQNPLPHTGTAALVSLAAAAVLPTAASTLGLAQALLASMPFGPGSAPQPPSGAPHGLSAPGEQHPRPQAPLSAGLHGSSPLCSRGNLRRAWISA